MKPQLLFLPGASGNVDFWKPVAALLRSPVEEVHHLGWPGFGTMPSDPTITTLQELADQVASRVQRPTAVVGQSMGGVIALLVALAKPEWVTHLVIAALAGGIDLRRHGAREWRPPRQEIDPRNPAHLFFAYDKDLSPLLSSIRVPTLLLWGDSDPVSPAGAGQWLASTLPNATLHVIPGGTHTFANTRAADVAPLVDCHLLTTA